MEGKNAEISARIAGMIEILHETPNSFAKKLGYSRSQTIYDILNGKSAPSYDFFNKVFSTEYSEVISAEWLLTGNGTMLKQPADHLSVPEKQPETTVSEPIEPRSNPVQTPIRKETRQQNADPSPDVILSLLETIRQQAEEIGMLKERLRAVEEEREKLAEAAQSSDVADAG